VIGLFEQGIFKDVILSAPIPASLEELCGILEMPVPSIPKTICLSDNQAISWQPAWYQAALSTQSAHANLMGTNPFDAFTTPGHPPNDISLSEADLEVLTNLSLPSPPTLRRPNNHRDLLQAMSHPSINAVGVTQPMLGVINNIMTMPLVADTAGDGPKRRDSGFAETVPSGRIHGLAQDGHDASVSWKDPGFDVHADETYFSHGSFGSFGSSASLASQVYGNEEQWQVQDELPDQAQPQRKRTETRITEVISPDRSVLHTDSDLSPRGPVRKRKFDSSEDSDEGLPKSKVIAIKTTHNRTGLKKADKAKAVKSKANVSKSMSSKAISQTVKSGKTTQSKVTSSKVTKPSISKKSVIGSATSSKVVKKKPSPPLPPAKRFQPTPRTQKPSQQSSSSNRGKPPPRRQQKAARRDFDDDDDEIIEEDRDDTGDYVMPEKKNISITKQRHLSQSGGRGRPIHIE
jgi:hypothetical protein